MFIMNLFILSSYSLPLLIIEEFFSTFLYFKFLSFFCLQFIFNKFLKKLSAKYQNSSNYFHSPLQF